MPFEKLLLSTIITLLSIISLHLHEDEANGLTLQQKIRQASTLFIADSSVGGYR